MNGLLARKAVIQGIRAVLLQTRTAGQGIMVQDITEEDTIDNKYRKGRQSQGAAAFFGTGIGIAINGHECRKRRSGIKFVGNKG